MEANTEKYKRIVENTIIQCNRIFTSWQKERSNITYADEISVFRSYLSRFIRHEFNNRILISTSSSMSEHTCEIKNGKVISMNLTSISDDNYKYNGFISGLCEYARGFDFINFYKRYSDYEEYLEEYLERQSQLSDLESITFDEIKNIKF